MTDGISRQICTGSAKKQEKKCDHNHHKPKKECHWLLDSRWVKSSLARTAKRKRRRRRPACASGLQPSLSQSREKSENESCSSPLKKHQTWASLKLTGLKPHFRPIVIGPSLLLRDETCSSSGQKLSSVVFSASCFTKCQACDVCVTVFLDKLASIRVDRNE